MATMHKLILLLLPLAVFGMPTNEEKDLELVESRASSSCVCGKENKNAGDRISGGREAVANKYPWMVRLTDLPCWDKKDGSWGRCVCGGSLISDRHVLTAYHCINDWEEYHKYNPYGRISKENVLVSVHDQHDESDYEKVKVSKVVYPKGEGRSHDIAIIVLANPVSFKDTIHPICLPESDEDVYKGERTKHLGWGMTGYGQNGPRNLKEVDLTVSESSHSNKNLFYTDIVKVNGKYEDPCAGDSGGPLMHKTNDQWTIIGTVQGGGYDCRTNKLFDNGRGKWNKVTAHLKWIKKILKSDYRTTVCSKKSYGGGGGGSAGGCSYTDENSSRYCSRNKYRCSYSSYVKSKCTKTCSC